MALISAQLCYMEMQYLLKCNLGTFTDVSVCAALARANISNWWNVKRWDLFPVCTSWLCPKPRQFWLAASLPCFVYEGSSWEKSASDRFPRHIMSNDLQQIWPKKYQVHLSIGVEYTLEKGERNGICTVYILLPITQKSGMSWEAKHAWHICKQTSIPTTLVTK